MNFDPSIKITSKKIRTFHEVWCSFLELNPPSGVSSSFQLLDVNGSEAKMLQNSDVSCMYVCMYVNERMNESSGVPSGFIPTSLIQRCHLRHKKQIADGKILLAEEEQ